MKSQVIVALLIVPCILAGCTESEINATDDALGCTYSDAENYNSSALVDDGSCFYSEQTEIILGCTYSQALNYNQDATEDDGSCRYPVVEDSILGCTYSDAYNYDMNATEDDGTCIYDSDGDGIIDDFEEAGCTDSSANNHNTSSTDDDGSCDYDEDDDGVYDWAETEGCLDPNATNYDASASDDNQTMCEYPYVMNIVDLENFLDDSDALESSFVNLRNDTAFIKVIDVTESSEEELMESDNNANTTAVEVIFGHDPINEIVYNSMVIRFMGDISMEQTTVQGPDGINYRIGSPDSGSWYYARDEVYQFENQFEEDEEDDDGGASEDDEEGSMCDDFFDNDPFNWPDNWTLSHDNGINKAEGISESKGLGATLELVGNPPRLSHVEISQINGMARCSIGILDHPVNNLAIDTNLPRTSMTMKLENEFQDESSSTKTWSADLSDEHFEEVNLTEIEIRVTYTESNDDGEEVTHVVDSMKLSEQTSTYTDQCFQWTLSWADNDNDGYTSSGDAYTVTRTDRVIDPCPEEDDYRYKDFQIVFYDLWADMPTGGVFTPGFGYIIAITAILASSMITGKRDW